MLAGWAVKNFFCFKTFCFFMMKKKKSVILTSSFQLALFNALHHADNASSICQRKRVINKNFYRYRLKHTNKPELENSIKGENDPSSKFNLMRVRRKESRKAENRSSTADGCKLPVALQRVIVPSSLSERHDVMRGSGISKKRMFSFDFMSIVACEAILWAVVTVMTKERSNEIFDECINHFFLFFQEE